MTQDEFDCLAYVVIDPNEWEQHAIKTFGAEKAQAMLAAKVERWWKEFKIASAQPGYQTRAERECLPT